MASDTPDNLEHLMNGSESIEIEAKAHPDTVREVLKSVKGIESVRTESGETGTVYAKIEVKTGTDIREEIFFAFAEKKIPLLMMKTAKISLEEVFMELTQKEGDVTHEGSL